MNGFRCLWRSVNLVVSVAIVWLALYGAALAQVKKEEPKSSSTTGSGAYVMSYGLVILGITLGLLVVCRSSGRRDRSRPEQYMEGKVAGIRAEEENPDEKKPGAKKPGK
jgi:hypothetical protein